MNLALGERTPIMGAQFPPPLPHRPESVPPYTPEPTTTQPWAKSTVDRLWGSQSLSTTPARCVHHLHFHKASRIVFSYRGTLGDSKSPVSPCQELRAYRQRRPEPTTSPLQPATVATNAMLSPITAFEGHPPQVYPGLSTFEPAFTTSPMTTFAGATSGAGTVHQEQWAQPASPNVTLVQLRGSQEHPLNNQMSPWIRALDVDRSYRSPQPTSSNQRPGKCLLPEPDISPPKPKLLWLFVG